MIPHTIAFAVERSVDGAYAQVRVSVSGRDLIEYVRAAEEPWAVRDGQPSLAGRYTGLWLEQWVSPPSVADDFGRVPVLACECGAPGCWPLLASISRSKEYVSWSDFTQPHRPHWDLSSLGPFVFARVPYDAAMRDLRREAGLSSADA